MLLAVPTQHVLALGALHSLPARSHVEPLLVRVLLLAANNPWLGLERPLAWSKTLCFYFAGNMPHHQQHHALPAAAAASLTVSSTAGKPGVALSAVGVSGSRKVPQVGCDQGSSPLASSSNKEEWFCWVQAPAVRTFLWE